MVFLRTKKTSSSKIITPELNLDLQDTRIGPSGMAKTSSIDHNQEQDDEEASVISLAASSYGDV